MIKQISLFLPRSPLLFCAFVLFFCELRSDCYHLPKFQLDFILLLDITVKMTASARRHNKIKNQYVVIHNI